MFESRKATELQTVSSLSLDIEGGRRFDADLRYGESPFREGPYLVAVCFSRPNGSASSGIALTELLSPDYWGRCEDGSLALLPHAAPDKGKSVPQASSHKLSASEAAVLFSWLRQELEGVAGLGPRSRVSALAS